MRSHDFLNEDWQKVNKQDKTDGMSDKAVKAYRKENPGSKLKTAVTKKPSELKAGSKDAKRRKSFCARMSGMKKAHASAETKRDPDSPINKALRRWNCESIEELEQALAEATFGTEPKRPARAGSRPIRGHGAEPRYKSAPVVPGGDNPDAPHKPNKGDEPVQRGDHVLVQDPDNIATVHSGVVKRIGREFVYVTLKNGETVAAPHDEVSKNYDVLSKRAHLILNKKGPSKSKYKVDETKKLSSREKFLRGLKRGGYDVEKSAAYWDAKVKELERQRDEYEKELASRKQHDVAEGIFDIFKKLPAPGSTVKIAGRPVEITHAGVGSDYIGYAWKDKNGKEHYEETPAEEHNNLRSLAKTIAAEIKYADDDGVDDELDAQIKGRLDRHFGKNKDVAEAGSRYTGSGIHPKLVEILKQRGYKGPYQLGKLKKWYAALADTLGVMDTNEIMVTGNDVDYDEWVVKTNDGDYAYGAEMGYTTGDANRVIRDTVPISEQDVEEECAGVGIVTKQNSTADVGPGTIKKNLKAFNLEEILSELGVDQTFQFAKKAHGDQMYGDQPYWTHPRAVAAAGKRFFGSKFNNDAIKVAFLHDVVEDTPYKLEQLKNMGLSPEVIEAVELLTKNKALSYEENIKRIIASGNRLAMMVKYADNYKNYTGDKSNFEPSRAERLQKKYGASLDMLGSKLGINKHADRDSHVADMEQELEEWKASRQLCRSSTPDSELGASALASCKSQGLRARDGKKSHKIGNKRITVGGHRIKGKKYGGPLPDYGTRK